MSDELKISDSIASFSRRDWDALTENDVYGQYGWLLSVEETVRDAGRARYFLMYRAGKPAAAAVLYEYQRADLSGRLGDLLFGRAKTLLSKLRLAPARIIYCGPIIGQGRHVFWNKKCDTRETSNLLALMLEHIAIHCSRENVPIVFGRIPEDEPELLGALRDFGCIESLTWPISYMDMKWQTFDEYLKSLSRIGKNMSTKARREVAAPGKLGVSIEPWNKFSDRAAEILELLRETNRKHGNGSPSFDRSFIETLEKNHEGGALMNVAVAGSEQSPLGTALLLRAGNHAAGPLIGVSDNDLSRRAFTYFNLSLYEPVKYCIEQRLSRVYFGSGLAPMKRKRGCEQMDVFVFVHTRGWLSRLGWRAWMWLHRHWITQKSARTTA